MSRAAHVEPDALTTGRADLINHLDHHTADGNPAPCRTGTGLHADTWTSDNADDQQLAADACRDCHGATACRAFGLAWPNLFGTYGGLTNAQRARTRRTPRT